MGDYDSNYNGALLDEEQNGSYPETQVDESSGGVTDNKRRREEDPVPDPSEPSEQPAAKRTNFGAQGYAPAGPVVSAAGYDFHNNPELQLSSEAQIGADGRITEKMSCAADVVGRVIGKGGETIKELQARTGCNITVNQQVDPREVIIIGDRDYVLFAKKMCKAVMFEGPQGMNRFIEAGSPDRSPLVVDYEMSCPGTVIGRVIGKGGETIHRIQKESGYDI